MFPRRTPSLIIAALVFGLGLLAGFALSRNGRDTGSSSPEQSGLAGYSPAGSGRNSSDSPTRFVDEADLAKTLISAASEKDALLRAHQLRQTIYHLNSEQLSAAFK